MWNAFHMAGFALLKLDQAHELGCPFLLEVTGRKFFFKQGVQ
jgi:hypothetical protein